MAFGQELSDILLEKNITVKELSELTDIPASTLYSLIKRDNNTVNLDYVNRICDVLGPNYANKLLSSTKLSKFIGSGTKVTGLARALSPSHNLAYENIYTTEKKLLRNYHSLNSEGQELLYRYSKDLYDLPRYKRKKD